MDESADKLEDGEKHRAETVSSAERDKEVRWICAMGRKLGFGLNTIGLTIAILDRILCTVLVRSKYINCVAVAALYLAVKLHEEYTSDEEKDKSVFDAAHLVSQLRVHYSVAELNRMERSLLRVLNWDLMLPSCDRFLQAMLVVIGAPHLADTLALRENFERVVSAWQLACAFRPSILALSLLSLMLQMTSTEWFRITQSLKQIFKIDDLQFIKCRSEMAEMFKRQHFDSSKENNIKIQKYKSIATQTFTSPCSYKSRKRSRQAIADEDGYYFSDHNIAGKGNEEEANLNRDVLHVLYNILNAQLD